MRLCARLEEKWEMKRGEEKWEANHHKGGMKSSKGTDTGLVLRRNFETANFEGCKQAGFRKKGKGISFSNPEKLRMLLEAYYSRPYSLRELGQMFGCSRMTVWRVVQQYELVKVRA